MPEIKPINPQKVKILDTTGFYSDKPETPKEVVKLSEKLKNMEPKPDVKNDRKRDAIEKADKYEITLKKKSTKNNVDH
jgi:hypothetical protein